MTLYTGFVSTYVGSSTVTGHVDGALTSATFDNPIGLAVDTNGVVYVSDTSYPIIRMITTSG
jgi:hypothetical protein